MEKLKLYSEQFRKFYTSLPRPRRVALWLSVLMVVGIFIALAALFGSEDWRPLLSDASPEDVQAIIQNLKKANIPTRVSAAGDQVLVPRARLDEARMEVASSDQMRGGTGYELFDRRDYGLSSFQEQINFRRALEGELARTIRSLSEIRQARVHLVLPRQTLFKEEKVQPSASVVVSLRPGRNLGEKQIRGIRQLVASAVEGLVPGRVTILDEKGTLLARQHGSDGEAVAADKLEYQQQLERTLEGRVLSLLEPVVGSGKAVVQVTADVEVQKVRETDEQYDPDTTAKRSEQSNQEFRGQKDQQAEGVPGSRSNLPGGEDAVVSGRGVIFERNQKTVNYEISRKVREVHYGALQVKRLSAAVVVDGKYVREGEGENAKMTYQPRSPEEMKLLETLVKTAIGFDASRGDQVGVSNMPFQGTEDTPEETSWWAQLDLSRLLQTVLLAVAALLLLLFVVRPLLKPLWQTTPAVMADQGTLAGARVVSEPLMAGLLEGAPEQLPAPAATAGSSIDRQALQSMGLSARRLADEQPERTLQLIRNWLAEDTR